MSSSLGARALTAVIRGYQRWLSPMFGQRCRFYPTCSAYAVEALNTRGALVGSVLAAWRILRCNPWARGGVDDVPVHGQKWASWDGVVVGKSSQNLPEHLLPTASSSSSRKRNSTAG